MGFIGLAFVYYLSKPDSKNNTKKSKQTTPQPNTASTQTSLGLYNLLY